MLLLVMSIFLWFSVPRKQVVIHIPEAPRQPGFPTGPYSLYRDPENVALCFQLRIQNLSP